jgi:hypothetical protein
MLQAIGLAVSDLTDRHILRIALQAIMLALLIFAAVAGVLFWCLSGSDPCSFAGLGACPLDPGSSGLGAIFLTLLAAWLLFPAVLIAVLATMTDRIGRAVEERHYPQAASAAQPIGVGQGLALGARSAGRLLLFNLVALPFYVLLLVTGIGPLILFVIVNGFAFGRDVAELAAARHGDSASRRAWLKSTRGQQALIGTVISALFLVPIANLAAPIIGVAAGIHLFNRSFWTRPGVPDRLDSRRTPPRRSRR